MEETGTFVNLNCLNCGARLKINDNIFEFACQYCGVSQIVQRSGGIVALKFLSDKIDRVQNSVDKTAGELKIQRLQRAIEVIEEKHRKLVDARVQLKSHVNPIAIAAIVAIAAPFLLAASYTGSIILLLICGIAEFIFIWLWRLYINRIDFEFDRGSKPLIEKGVELRREITRLKKIVED